MERCPSHSGVSEPVRDRGNFSRDERPPHWRLVAAAPLDRQQDPSPRLVLHDCGAAPSAAVAASTPSRFALIDERFAEKPEPNRSEEHTSELQSRLHLVCRLLLEKKKMTTASRRASCFMTW